jgi:hypothetical protein
MSAPLLPPLACVRRELRGASRALAARGLHVGNRW